MANNNYLTPKKYIPYIREVLDNDITLDIFSSELANERIKAKNFYSIENSAWGNLWYGNCYANPPYSRGNLPRYSRDLIANFDAMQIIQSLSLLPNSTSEKWFQNLINHRLAAVCFTDHRVHFTSFEKGRFVENSNPDFGNAFVYLGQQIDVFSLVFRRWGTIMRKI